MSVLKSWTGGAIVLLALAGGVRADVTMSGSNNPTASIDVQMSAVLGRERSGMRALEPNKLASLFTPISQKSSNRKPGSQPSADISFDSSWLAKQPQAKGDAQFECLATALYFEARGESIAGQAAVAEVILNRVESNAYPHTICGVVGQGSERRNGCQFSFACDGKPEAINEPGAFARAAKIARAMIDGAPRELTEGATHFHTPSVRPSWAKKFTRTAKIGAHIFYRPAMRTASN